MLSASTLLLATATAFGIGWHLARTTTASPRDVEAAYVDALLEADLEPGNYRDLRFVDGADAVLTQLEDRGLATTHESPGRGHEHVHLQALLEEAME